MDNVIITIYSYPVSTMFLALIYKKYFLVQDVTAEQIQKKKWIKWWNNPNSPELTCFFVDETPKSTNKVIHHYLFLKESARRLLILLESKKTPLNKLPSESYHFTYFDIKTTYEFEADGKNEDDYYILRSKMHNFYDAECVAECFKKKGRMVNIYENDTGIRVSIGKSTNTYYMEVYNEFETVICKIEIKNKKAHILVEIIKKGNYNNF